MKNNKGYIVVLVCLLVSSIQGDTNQFVKEKKNKKVSVARLKEGISETIANSLLHTTQAVESYGKLQREYMQMMAALVEQSKDSKLTHADRLALDKTLTELTAIERDLETSCKRLSHHIEVVKKQY